MYLTSSIEEHLLKGVPRQVLPFTGTIRRRVRFWIVFFLTTIITAAIATHHIRAVRSLVSEGAVVRGRIAIHCASNASCTNWPVTYEFPKRNGWLSDGEDCSDKVCYESQIGDPVAVTYLPNDPSVHRLGIVTRADVREIQGEWCIAAFFIMLPFLYGFVTMERRISRNFYLVRFGYPVVGTVRGSCSFVVECSEFRLLSYEYPLDNGLTKQSSTLVTRTQFDTMREESTFTVLRSPQNPEIAEPYFQLQSEVTIAER